MNNMPPSPQNTPTKARSAPSPLCYTVIRNMYTFVLWLLLPLAIARLYWKSRENPAYRSRIRQRLGLQIPKLDGCILVHAVSVGEAVAAVPFIEKLLEEFPSKDILVTSTTPTGSDRVKSLFGGRVEQCFLPFDTSLFMAKLLKQTKPCAVVVIETEIWPNLIYQCSQRKIPVLLANARLSERSYKGYRKLRWLTEPTLKRMTQIAAHAQPDLERFLALGALPTQANAIGSIKFDLQVPPNLKEKGDTLLATLPSERQKEKPFIWIAASTHDGEEIEIIKAANRLKERLPNSICVLVPRHIERFETVARLLEDRKIPFERFSSSRELPQNTSFLLGDTMGDLLLFYTIADAAFIGGSFVPVGGHNVLESLACNTTTLVGPHMFNFKSIHTLLVENKAIIEVASWEQLADHLYRLATNDILRKKLSERGASVVSANRGALDRLVAITHRLIAK